VSGQYRLEGHRIDRVRFRDRVVECDCGAVIRCADNESVELRNAALADAFADHRRAMIVEAKAKA
jgi:hypothetical protein